MDWLIGPRAHRVSLLAGSALLAVLTVAAVIAGVASGGSPTGNGDGPVTLTVVDGGGFDSPVYTAYAPGDADNLYVVEQGGKVWLVDGGEPRAEYLDIQDLTNGSGEQGLLSIAFHPQFDSNRLLYAYYTDASTGDIVVSEFNADYTDVDESSRRTVIRIRHRFASNHNGGTALFGPDGHLYLGTGDGGGAGDPRENGQDRRSLLGKLLRINPLDPAGPRRYTSPAGNPFKGKKGKDEIYALGLRNPFRFSFDGLNGRFLIADVGQNRFEEVNYEKPSVLRRANFGWDRFEGRKRYRDAADNESKRPKRRHHDKPIHVYSHSQGCSITGGVVARDPTLPNLFNRYLYADFCNEQLRSLVPRLSGASDDQSVGVGVGGPGQFDGPSSITENPETAKIYVTSLGGDVWRLDP